MTRKTAITITLSLALITLAAGGAIAASSGPAADSSDSVGKSVSADAGGGYVAYKAYKGELDEIGPTEAMTAGGGIVGGTTAAYSGATTYAAASAGTAAAASGATVATGGLILVA